LASVTGSNRVAVGGVEQAQRLELPEHGVEILDLLGNRHELPGRHILGQDPSLTVVDESSRRRQRFDANLVALRHLVEALVIDHLQMHQAPDQDASQREDDDRGADDPGQEQALFLPGVLELSGSDTHCAPRS
jgi:hypothetical protein